MDKTGRRSAGDCGGCNNCCRAAEGCGQRARAEKGGAEEAGRGATAKGFARAKRSHRKTVGNRRASHAAVCRQLIVASVVRPPWVTRGRCGSCAACRSCRSGLCAEPGGLKADRYRSCAVGEA